MSELLFKEETFAIRGTVFEVYKEMGAGFLEQVYQECMEKELKERGIPFVAQPELILSYKGKALQQIFRPDLLCYDQIIVELKAVKNLAPEHTAQILNYLRASKLRLGLLINFGSHPKVQIERLIL